jgi:hypothetical protein
MIANNIAALKYFRRRRQAEPAGTRAQHTSTCTQALAKSTNEIDNQQRQLMNNH